MDRPAPGHSKPQGGSMLRTFASLSLSMVVALALSIAGCSDGTTGTDDDAGSSAMDAARTDGSRADATTPPDDDASTPDDDASTSDPDGSTESDGGIVIDTDAGNLCATVRCSPGFECCGLDGTCQPAGCLACCSIDRRDAAITPRDGGGGSLCAAILCAPGAMCCESSGACVPIGCDACCRDPGTDRDGGAARDASIFPRTDGGGGARDCRIISCPGTMECCEATGACYDPRCLSCCMPRP